MDNQKLQEDLLLALEQNRLEDFRELLGNPAIRPNYYYGKPHYGSCLEIACRHRGKHEFLKLLLTKVKPNINTIKPEPIHFAAKKGNFEGLEVLLKDKRTKVDAEDSEGRTALHHAIENFKTDGDLYEKCVKLLLEHPRIDINKPSRKGFTAIHEAAERGTKRAVQSILKYSKSGIDLDRYRARGRSARDSILINYPELEKDLPLPIFEIKSTDPHIQLLTALKNKNIDVLRVLLGQQDADGKHIHDPNHWYCKPINSNFLEIACREKGCEAFIEVAIHAGADPNIVNRLSEKSPIHVAAEFGNHEALHVLLVNKANVNALDKFGRSALHYTVMQSDSEEGTEEKLKCLTMLLDHDDLDIDLVDNNGHCPLMSAVLSCNKKSVIAMLQQKKHVLYLDYEINFNTIRKIILKTFPDLKDKLSQVPSSKTRCTNVRWELTNHLHKGHEKEFALLLENQDTNACQVLKSDTLCHFLQFACTNGLRDAVKALLDLGTDPNSIRSKNRSPPFVLACENQHFEIMKLFLQLPNSRGFNINACDIKGNTALHYAVWQDDLESVIFLINAGAILNCENVYGNTPFCAAHVESLLNKCIKTKHFATQEEYEVIFDYRLLTARPRSYCHVQTDKSSVHIALDNIESTPLNGIHCLDHDPTDEMKFLYFVSQSKEFMRLLCHPVALTFLELKLHGLKLFSYVNLAIYMIFLLCLSTHVILMQNTYDNHTEVNNLTDIDHQEDDGTFDHRTLKQDSEQNSTINCIKSATFFMLFALLLFLSIRELFQLTMSFSKYIKNKENILDIAIIVLATCVIFLPSVLSPRHMKIIIVMAIMVSWTELLLLVGRISRFANYIEMLTVVLKNYFTVSLFYSILIIAFALSFHVLFYEIQDDDNWFNSLPISFLKTLIMMTGEFDIDRKTFNSIPILAPIVFVLFVILMTIVLLNLLIGLAVNDTQAIQNNAELLSLETKVKVALEVESILIHFHKILKSICPCIPFICVHLHNVSLFSACSLKKEGSVKPNISPHLKLSSRESPIRLGCSMIEKAITIINKQSKDLEPVNDEKERLQKLEDSVEKILNILQAMQGQYKSDDNTSHSDMSDVLSVNSFDI